MTLDWADIPSDLPDLFDRLRALEECEVWVRVGQGMGEGRSVAIPAAILTLRGRLRLPGDVDRFGIDLPGQGESDFAWFARRKGRGRGEYWQVAVERHAEGHPVLVLYVT